MDWSSVRQWSQIALIAFCLAASGLAFAIRGKKIKMVYMGHAICGLLLFAAWQLLSSLSIKDIGPFTRSGMVPYISILEALTAADAWVWLILAARSTFSLSFSHHKTENGNARSQDLIRSS